MFLTTVHILAIASVAGGVRVSQEMSVSSLGSIDKRKPADSARTWSQRPLATTQRFINSTHLYNATHVEAFDHDVVLVRQRRNALIPKAVPKSLLNLSQVVPKRVPAATERVGKWIGKKEMELPGGKRCVMQKEKCLGMGSFGSVYACVLDDNSQVAIKFIKVEAPGVDPIKEFNMQKMVVSKHVIQPISWFRTEGRAEWDTTCDGSVVKESIPSGTKCIVMEKGGPELFNVLRLPGVGPALDIALTKRIWSMVLVAFMRIHQQGMIYCDLKPENILVGSADLHATIVKLTDFGFAKIHEPNTVETELCGTPEYLAPEQFDIVWGEDEEDDPELVGGRYGVAVDAWELGVLLYELYVGRPPFGISLQHVVFNIMNATFDPMKFGISNPGDDTSLMMNLMQNLLQRDPKKRRCVWQSNECVNQLIAAHPWVKSEVDNLLREDATFISARGAV